MSGASTAVIMPFAPMLRNHAGGSYAAASRPGRKATRSRLMNLHPAKNMINAHGYENAPDDREHGGERWDSANALRDRNRNRRGERFGRHREGDGLAAAKQPYESVATDHSDNRAGA